jgi:tRNA A37 threonylcarbamoyladenosine dehydratase
VSGKIELALQSHKSGIPIISSMGAGNKVDATAFEVADIYDTSICPLAKVMRHELRKRGIPRLKVVYSKEIPIVPDDSAAASCQTDCVCPPGAVRKCTHRRQIPGSNAFVPAAAGLILAGEVVKDLIHTQI